MDSKDVIDDVNALLKLGVGDPYRLEHIKQAYMLNSTIWKSDDKYLEQLREKYLVKHRIDQPDIEPEIDEKTENESEDKNMIHCWKCGKKSPTRANFCMICGSSIFEVGEEPKTADVQMPSTRSRNQTKRIGLKIPILIGIPVLILIIIGGAYSQGFWDNSLERQSTDDSTSEVMISTEDNSKCGLGTVFDPDANSCVLGSAVESKDSTSEAPTEANSKCGPGTVFDPDANSCVLDK